MRLPNFLIAGVQRGASTTTKSLLGKHPNIYMAPKEIHFFDNFWELGIKWYTTQFVEKENVTHYGEKTPEYIFLEGCLQRIKQTIPDVKFIILLRNPVNRAFSLYKVNRSIRKIPFDKVFKHGKKFMINEKPMYRHDHYDLLSRGFYAKQLKIFQKYFSMEQLHISIFERFVKNVNGGLNEMVHFLGLSSFDFPEAQLFKSPSKDMSSVQRAKLVDFYKEPNKRLFDMIGDIPEWRQ